MLPFSVLMSLYWKERPEFLRQSLNSVLHQTLSPKEIILVEDGPLTPELYEVVNEYVGRYPIITVVKLSKNGGLGNALNEGLKHCTYDIVARMDTDDIAKPHRFEHQLNYMEGHDDIAACSSWIDEFIGTSENVTSVKKLPENHGEIFKYGKTRCPMNHPAVIYRKHIIQQVGGYGPFPEDYYLWGKLLVNGYKMHNIQESLLFFRSTPDVYKRRGGTAYFRSMYLLQKFLRDIGYISGSEFIKNMSIRGTVALLPNAVRKLFYDRMLRVKATK